MILLLLSNMTCCAALQSDAMPINQWQYNDELAELCGPDLPKSASWRRQLSSLILPKAVFARPDTFRDRPTEEEAQAFEEANQILRDTLALLRRGPASPASSSNAGSNNHIAMLSKL